LTVVTFSRALTQSDEGLGDAIRLLKQAYARHPDDFWLNCELGFRLFLSGMTGSRPPENSDDSLRYFSVAAGLRPNDANIRIVVGTELEHKRLLQEAVNEFREALRHWPKDAFAHTCLGDALLRQGRVDEGISVLREAIRLGETAPRTFANLGLALGQT